MLEENKSLLKFCRTCFSNKDDLRTVFDFCNCHNVFISEMLMECCSIQVKYNDNSSLMCQKCLKILHISYDFRKKCIESQKFFENCDIFQMNSFFEKNELVKSPEDNKLFEEKDKLEKVQLLDDNLNSSVSDLVDHFNDKTDEIQVVNDIENKHLDIKKPNNIKKQGSVQCTKCDRFFDSSVKMLMHRDYYHIELSKPLKRGKLLSCTKCSRTFRQKRSLTHHILVSHLNDKPQLNCPQCSLTFTLEPNLRRHILTVHEKKKLFPCEICNKKFTAKYSLKLHRETCSKEKSRKKEKLIKCRDKHTCFICEQFFYNKDSLDQHVALHSDPNSEKYPCDQCEIVFVCQIGLKRHKIKVHGEKREAPNKPELCSLCGKSFITQHHLREHINSHLNERPHKCTICGKGFAYQSCYSLHMRIHTNTRKFKCEWCERKFVQKQQLVAHSRLHTGEKPYSCDLCGRTFSQKTNRDAHRRTHTGEKPYACNMCDEKFYDAGRLSKHKKKMHVAQNKVDCS